jgi:hypothetical protein
MDAPLEDIREYHGEEVLDSVCARCMARMCVCAQCVIYTLQIYSVRVYIYLVFQHMSCAAMVQCDSRIYYREN